MTPLSAIPSVPGIGQTQLVVPAGPAAGGTGAASGTGGFAQLLSQNQADAASQAVATGQSSDLAGATVAVEKASIAIDLVSSIRNKAVDAYQDIMRMQV